MTIIRAKVAVVNVMKCPFVSWTSTSVNSVNIYLLLNSWSFTKTGRLLPVASHVITETGHYMYI